MAQVRPILLCFVSKDLAAERQRMRGFRHQGERV
jgi:hypothetical protein